MACFLSCISRVGILMEMSRHLVGLLFGLTGLLFLVLSADEIIFGNGSEWARLLYRTDMNDNGMPDKPIVYLKPTDHSN